MSNKFKVFCVLKEIQYNSTVLHIPQQKSKAERMNRTLVEKALAMIHGGANLGKELWEECNFN